MWKIGRNYYKDCRVFDAISIYDAFRPCVLHLGDTTRCMHHTDMGIVYSNPDQLTYPVSRVIFLAHHVGVLFAPGVWVADPMMGDAAMPREPADAIGKEAVVGMTYACMHASSRVLPTHYCYTENQRKSGVPGLGRALWRAVLS